MSKLYQHIHVQDEEHFGHVTKLKYIDNSDPYLTLYVFEDGTKCNVEFIAPLNDTTAFDGQHIMAEVPSMTNIWKFNKKEIKAEKRKTSFDETSKQNFEIPDPYMMGKIDGGLAGTQEASVNMSEARVRIDSMPPKPVVVKNEESIDNYLLIDENGETRSIDEIEKLTKTKQPSVKKQEVKTTDKTDTDTTTAVVEENETVNSWIVTTNQVQVPSYKIDLDTLNNGAKISIITNGECIEFETLTKFVECLTNKHNDEFIGIENKPELNLVKNMIDMSKKEEATVSLDITLQLPPKDIYDVIQKAYPTEMSESFVNLLANNISINDLRFAVAAGLSSFYNNTLEENAQ